MNPGSQIGPATLDFRSYPLPDGGTGIDLYLKKSAFHDAFTGDLPLEWPVRSAGVSLIKGDHPECVLRERQRIDGGVGPHFQRSSSSRLER